VKGCIHSESALFQACYTALLFLFLVTTVSRAEIRVYPSPGDLSSIAHLKPCTRYTVRVNGQSSFVYTSDNYWQPGDSYPKRLTDSVAFTGFDFRDEPATVEITYQGTLHSVKIRPGIDSRALQNYSLSGNTISFTLTDSRYLSIEVNDQLYPLFLFADTIETVRPSDYDVVFGAGVHTIGSQYALSSGQRVYIEGGAVVF
jgi:hypothetical protein